MTQMHTLTRTHTTLGEMISAIYDEFMELYGDEDIASVATASVVNDILSRPCSDDEALIDAA